MPLVRASPLIASALLSAILLASLPACAVPRHLREIDRPALHPRDLLGATIETLRERIPDLRLDREILVETRRRFHEAPDHAARRAVIRSLLAAVPTSHLSLFSEYAKDHFDAELRGEARPTLGFSLIEIDGSFRIGGVLARSPAQEAGIVRGDLLVQIDGFTPELSPRLDPRHDDAAVPRGSSIDPEAEGAHLVRVAAGERVALVIEPSGPGAPTRIALELPVVVTSSLASDRARVRVVEVPVAGDRPAESRHVSVGVLPFSYIYSRGSSNHFVAALTGPLRDVDALVLDLRGRGGSGLAMAILTSFITRDTTLGDLPLVATIDRRTRSAKEVIARAIREHGVGVLVGERTPGAVRGCGWVELVDGEWLLCPRGAIGEDPRGLEGVGVAPDIAVDDPFPHGGGTDPILETALAVAARLSITSGRGSPPSRGAPLLPRSRERRATASTDASSSPPAAHLSHSVTTSGTPPW